MSSFTEDALLSDVSSEDSRSPEARMLSRAMKASMAELWQKDLFSDFKIIARGRTIKTHKFILSALSPVFKRMLESDFQENERGDVRIDDFDYEVVMLMLEYLYKGVFTGPMGDMADKLLEIAEKYNIEALKSKCSKRLESILNVNNALQILRSANQNNAPKLMGRTLLFIKDHYEDIRGTTNWNDFRNKYPDLLEKVTDAGYNYFPKKPRLE